VLADPLVGAFVPNLELSVTRYDAFRSQGISAVVTVPEIDPNDPALAPLRPYEVVYSGPDGNLLQLGVVDGAQPLGLVSVRDRVEVLPGDADVLDALATSSAANGPILTSEGAVEDSDLSADDVATNESPRIAPARTPAGAARWRRSSNERGINSLSVDVDAPGSDMAARRGQRSSRVVGDRRWREGPDPSGQPFPHGGADRAGRARWSCASVRRA
jgi:hypothetical protein